MRRGEIWTVAGGADYAGKPRPSLIVQDDSYAGTASVTICLITTDQIITGFVRPPLKPDSINGLVASSRVMVDKISTVPRAKLRSQVGYISS